jgi:hypothetical protein
LMVLHDPFTMFAHIFMFVVTYSKHE